MSEQHQHGYIAEETGLKYPEVTTTYPDDSAVFVNAEVITVAYNLVEVIDHFQGRYNRVLRGRFVHKHKNTRRRQHKLATNSRDFGKEVRVWRQRLETFLDGHF